MDKRSSACRHYIEFFDEVDKTRNGGCNYCGKVIKADNNLHGTTGLLNHQKACRKKPHEVKTNQNRLQFQPPRPGKKRWPCL